MLSTVSDAIRDVRNGKMLIVLDSAERENEADFFMPAEAATPEAVRIMIKHGGGIICVALTQAHAERLRLPLMVPLGENTEKTQVNFTIPVDAAHGITTGVSAHDRARTIRVIADAASHHDDLVRPGHVPALIARAGGLAERRGHTEAAVELARLAGWAPAGVLCEIVGESGHMAQWDEIALLASSLGIRAVAIEDIVHHLRAHPLCPSFTCAH